MNERLDVPSLPICSEETVGDSKAVSARIVAELENVESANIHYIAGGGSGDVFVHPNNPNKCIKLAKDASKNSSIVAEYDKYQALGRACVGTSDTSRDGHPTPIIKVDNLVTHQARACFCLDRGISLDKLLTKETPRVRVYTRVANQQEYAESAKLVDDWTAKFYKDFWGRLNCLEKGDRELQKMVTELDEALSAMHDMKRYHLDIKPQNIMVVRDEGAFHYRFFDLGSMQTEDEWRNEPAFETTHRNLPPQLNVSSDGSSNPNRSSIHKADLHKLCERPWDLDRYQLGKTVSDIVQDNHSYRAIQDKLTKTGKEVLLEIARLYKDAPKHKPSKWLRRSNLEWEWLSAESLFSRIDNRKYEFLREFMPGLLTIPETQPCNVGPNIKDILKTHLFLRLKGIRQLGFKYKVFPGAMHTRYEHCLGTYEACLEYISHLLGRSGSPWFAMCVNEIKDLKLTTLYALLHDIGHYPYAHYVESLGPFPSDDALTSVILQDTVESLKGKCGFPYFSGTNGHVASEKRLLISHVKELQKQLEDGFDITSADWMKWYSRVFPKLAHSQPKVGGETDDGDKFYFTLRQILKSPIDVDTFDYTERDSTHCGFSAIGKAERKLFLNQLTVHSGLYRGHGDVRPFTLAIREQARCTLEQLVLAKYHLYTMVYYNSECRKYAALLRNLVYDFWCLFPFVVPAEELRNVKCRFVVRWCTCKSDDALLVMFKENLKALIDNSGAPFYGQKPQVALGATLNAIAKSVGAAAETADRLRSLREALRDLTDALKSVTASGGGYQLHAFALKIELGKASEALEGATDCPNLTARLKEKLAEVRSIIHSITEFITNADHGVGNEQPAHRELSLTKWITSLREASASVDLATGSAQDETSDLQMEQRILSDVSDPGVPRSLRPLNLAAIVAESISNITSTNVCEIMVTVFSVLRKSLKSAEGAPGVEGVAELRAALDTLACGTTQDPATKALAILFSVVGKLHELESEIAPQTMLEISLKESKVIYEKIQDSLTTTTTESELEMAGFAKNREICRRIEEAIYGAGNVVDEAVCGGWLLMDVPEQRREKISCGVIRKDGTLEPLGPIWDAVEPARSDVTNRIRLFKRGGKLSDDNLERVRSAIWKFLEEKEL